MKMHSKQFLIYLLLMLNTINSSCIILPVYIPRYDKSKSLLIDVSNVKPGITTKEDILLQFGTTFKDVSDNEKIFRATCSKKGELFLIYFVSGGYQAAVGAKEYRLMDIYQIEIEFDDNDIVKRCEVLKFSPK